MSDTIRSDRYPGSRPMQVEARFSRLSTPCVVPPSLRRHLRLPREGQGRKAEEAHAAMLRLLSGEYRTPGRHLGDEALARHLGIGRTPMREALIRLAAEGHILHVPQKGYFTRPLPEAGLLEAYDLIKVMLTFALGQPVSEAYVVGADLPTDPPEGPPEAAECLFQVIARRSGNETLVGLVGSLAVSTHPVRAEIAAQPRIRDAIRTSVERLQSALRDGGDAAIRKALFRHLAFEKRHVGAMTRDINARAMEVLPFVT